jgi:hypothetical protein
MAAETKAVIQIVFLPECHLLFQKYFHTVAAPFDDILHTASIA